MHVANLAIMYVCEIQMVSEISVKYLGEICEKTCG